MDDQNQNNTPTEDTQSITPAPQVGPMSPGSENVGPMPSPLGGVPAEPSEPVAPPTVQEPVAAPPVPVPPSTMPLTPPSVDEPVAPPPVSEPSAPEPEAPTPSAPGSDFGGPASPAAPTN